MPSDPENGVLGPIVYCGSVTVTIFPKPWYHCTWLCVHIMGRQQYALIVFLCIFDSISGSDNLLMGKLISQGASKSEVVGAARLEGGSDSQIEEVKVIT